MDSFKAVAIVFAYLSGVMMCAAAGHGLSLECFFGGATPVVAYIAGLFMRSPTDPNPPLMVIHDPSKVEVITERGDANS